MLGPLLDLSAPGEKRAIYFFQNVTAQAISGGFDAAFWRVTVLQISQTEPAVRHAVLAVSSLHEGLRAGAVTSLWDGLLSQPSQSFALQQYNKAISRLLAQMSNPLTKPLASLLTCVLFVCIEYMQGKDNEALIHLEQGRKLLTRLDQQSNDPEMQCIIRNIVPLYTRLSLTSFLFGGSPVLIPDSLKLNSDIPDTFETMDNMRHCMHDFMEQAFRFTQSARPAKNSSDSVPGETIRLLEVEQQRLLSRLAKLNVAFSLFRASTSKPGPEVALLVLQMYLHAQRIWISTALSSTEVVYDEYLSSFTAIIPLAAAYLDLEMSTQQHATAPAQRIIPPQYTPQFNPVSEQVSIACTSNFTFDTHIIPLLYYVATKCRHPLIRRSALQLLNRNPARRENLWRASVMGALAGHIVSIEECWAQEQQTSVAAGSSYNKGAGIPMNGLNVDVSKGHLSVFLSQTHEAKGNVSERNSSPEAEHNATVPNIVCSTSMSALSFDGLDVGISIEPSLDSSLFVDAEISSSLSHAPSLMASLEDRYSSSPAVESATAFVAPPNYNETWIWQQEQEQQRSQQSDLYQPSSHLALPNSSLYEAALVQGQQLHCRPCLEQGYAMGDNTSRSGSSDGSSIDLEEPQRYFPESGVLQKHHPVHVQQQQQEQHQVETIHQQNLGGHNALRGSSYPSHLIMEAPFGLPEELRVHDAIIGPERENGSWVAVFRKLHGVDADWDVQHDWVLTG